jgi:hypothetical protein
MTKSRLDSVECFGNQVKKTLNMLTAAEIDLLRDYLKLVEGDGHVQHLLPILITNGENEDGVDEEKERKIHAEGKVIDLSEKVDHPAHYNLHPSGVECVDIAEHYDFNLGNAIKYIRGS